MKCIDTTYIRPSRTIETILTPSKSVVFVYNYEGYHFRVFLDKKSMQTFFDDGIDSSFGFDNETDLDNYLLHI